MQPPPRVACPDTPSGARIDLHQPGVTYYAEYDASDCLRRFGRLEGQAQGAASSDDCYYYYYYYYIARMRAWLNR